MVAIGRLYLANAVEHVHISPACLRMGGSGPGMLSAAADGF